MLNLKRAQRNCLRVLKRKFLKSRTFGRTSIVTKLSDETTELEHCLAQSSTADLELLDAITDDAECDQVFDQCQNTQKAACQTLQAAKRMIAASSQPINPVATY